MKVCALFWLGSLIIALGSACPSAFKLNGGSREEYPQPLLNTSPIGESQLCTHNCDSRHQCTLLAWWKPLRSQVRAQGGGAFALPGAFVCPALVANSKSVLVRGRWLPGQLLCPRLAWWKPVCSQARAQGGGAFALPGACLPGLGCQLRPGQRPLVPRTASVFFYLFVFVSAFTRISM